MYRVILFLGYSKTTKFVIEFFIFTHNKKEKFNKKGEQKLDLGNCFNRNRLYFF